MKNLIRGAAASLSAIARGWMPDALAVCGVASVSYGAWLVYPAAGFVVGGLFMLAGGLLSARKAS